MNKKTNLLLIVCVLSIILLFSSTAFAWLDGFDYRKPITINSTTNISDYQKIIQLNHSVNMLSNFDDIRFTDVSNNNLSYWIEDKNDGINATVWVKTDVNTTGIIYIHYGNNTGVNSESNGTLTFDLYDNFNDNSIDTGKWTTHKMGSASAVVSETGGAMTLSGASGVISSGNLKSINTFTNNIIIEFERKRTSGTNGIHYRMVSLGTGNLQDTGGGTTNWYFTSFQTGYLCLTQNNDAGKTRMFYQFTAEPQVQIGTSVTATEEISFVNHKIIYKNDGSLKWYQNDVLKISATNTSYLNDNKYFMMTQGEHSIGLGDLTTYDNLTIRKYTSTEPTYSFGAEEHSNKAPTINITSPINTTYYTSSISVSIDINETDSTSFSCNISEDGTFLTEIITNTTYSDTLTKSVGAHNISVSCEDSDNKTSSATTYYYINTQPTISNLTSNPTTIRYAQNTTFNCSGNDVDDDNLTIYYRILDNDTDIYLMNWTTTNYYTFAYADAQHTAVISCLVDDGYINSTTYNISKYIHQVLNITAWDKNNNSILNFTTTVNGTSQNSTTGYSEFAVENGSYYITIDAPGYELKNDTITISDIHTYYNFSLYTTNSISFTFKDESTNNIIADRNITVELISTAFSSNHSTSDGTLYVDVLSPTEYTIRYAADGYTQRFYYFNLGNRTHTDLTLYLLNETTATDVTATVYDQNNNLLENVYIKVLRYDISTNSYLIQEIVKTNFEGVGVLHLILNDEFYRFILEYEGDVVDETTPSYIYATILTFQVLLGSNYGETFYNINDINYYLTFNNDTNNFRYTFSDINNIVSAGCLKVQRVSIMGNQDVSTSCVNSSSGTILLGVTNTSGATYKATGYAYFDDEEVYLISYLKKFVFEELSSDSGLFYVVLLMILFAFVGIWSPAVAVILTPLALIFGELIGLINVGMMYLVPIEILAIIVAYMINDKG